MLRFVRRLCLLLLISGGFGPVLHTLHAEYISRDYTAENYRRHPRMDEEDRLRGHSFRFKSGLEIIADVENVEVRIFGEKAGRTPWESDNLASGAYRVRLERTGFEILEFWVTLRSDRRTVVTVKMPALPTAKAELEAATVQVEESGDVDEAVKVGSTPELDTRFRKDARLSSTALPGLLYTEGTAMLPPGSWQISTGAAYFTGFDTQTTNGIPAWVAFRMSPTSGFEFTGRFGITAGDPTEESALAFSAGGAWRAIRKPGPFQLNLALLFAFNGYLTDLAIIPVEASLSTLPGAQISAAMEYGVGRWHLAASPSIGLIFLGNNDEQWRFSGPARVAGALGVGFYREDENTLAGISTKFHSSDFPADFLEWMIFSGIEGRVDLPGDAAFIALSTGFRVWPGTPVLQIGLEFGIVH